MFYKKLLIPVSVVLVGLGIYTLFGAKVEMEGDKVSVEKHVDLIETTAPETPPVGYGRIYVKSENSKLYFKNDEGIELNLPTITKFVTGSYTGNGTANRIINIGFTPTAVLIFPTNNTSTRSTAAAAIVGQYTSDLVGWNKNDAYFQGIVTNGFKTGTSTVWGTNENGVVYFYIAIAGSE